LHPHRPGGLQLRLTGAHRGGVDQPIRGQNMLRVVADAHPRAFGLDRGQRLGFLQVAAGHLLAARQVDAGQSRDADASDAHEVDARHDATCSTTRSTRRSASGRPSADDAALIALSRSASSPSSSASRRRPVNSASGTLAAAPAAITACAFSSWWAPPNVPGTRIIGSPTALTSPMVPTPARETT